jgi:hypothetical protein
LQRRRTQWSPGSNSVAKALGISFETTREHLRNLRRVDETLTFKGYGRGAAQMTPLDATRLLIAAAGSSFVKDSLQTLYAFQNLQSIGAGDPMRPDRSQFRTTEVSLEDYISLVIQRLIDLKGRLPISYQRPPHDGTQTAAIALTFMSVVDSDLPRVAVVPPHFVNLAMMTGPLRTRWGKRLPRWPCVTPNERT